MSAPYYESINLIERLHRQFMDVLKVELERANILDINNVQALILHNVGTDELTVGELTVRGYYLGSNVSYNVKKMVENGYIVQEKSIHDKRSTRVRLTDKGRALDAAITRLYKTHGERLAAANISNAKLESMNVALRELESFWSQQVGAGGLSLSA